MAAGTAALALVLAFTTFDTYSFVRREAIVCRRAVSAACGSGVCTRSVVESSWEACDDGFAVCLAWEVLIFSHRAASSHTIKAVRIHRAVLLYERTVYGRVLFSGQDNSR